MSEPHDIPVWRRLLYGAIVGAVLLTALNAAIESIETRRLLDTQTPLGGTSVLEDVVFVKDGDHWTTSAQTEQSMVRSRFPVTKAGKRVFVTGGSFAQGAPYTYPDQVEEGFGGITSWLREAVEGQAVEVINVAAGGQNSHRVLRVMEELVHLDPDAIVVATCNNEGALQPSALQEQLVQFGTYRLLTSLLRPTEKGSAPTFFQPDAEQLKEIDDAYEANLRSMIEAAKDQSVPLLLATVPLQLRHGGHEAGSGPAWIPGTWSGDEAIDACVAEGRRLLEGGDARAAALHLAGCGEHPAARETLEAAYMEVWRSGATIQDGDHPPGSCVADLVQRFRDGTFEELVEDALTCEDAPVDALFWSGLALAELDRIEEARATLEQVAELQPQGRCRPSLNALVRRLAAEHDHVTLVDLDAVARSASPKGLPGPELFASNCHLRWSGYWLMAQEIAEQLAELGLLNEAPTPSSEAALARAQEYGLGKDPWAESTLRSAESP